MQKHADSALRSITAFIDTYADLVYISICQSKAGLPCTTFTSPMVWPSSTICCHSPHTESERKQRCAPVGKNTWANVKTCKHLHSDALRTRPRTHKSSEDKGKSLRPSSSHTPLTAFPPTLHPQETGGESATPVSGSHTHTFHRTFRFRLVHLCAPLLNVQTL